MKKIQSKYILVWLYCLYALFSLSAQADIADDRAKLNELLKGGNWKEALEQAEKNFSGVSDENSGNDLKTAVKCMSKLNDYGQFETMINLVEEKHIANAKVLLQAAKSINIVTHGGVWIDNKFDRGHYRSGKRKKGEYANSVSRDRVLSIQLLEKAYALNAENKVSILSEWASTIMRGRSYNKSWRLQILTDVITLPEIERSYSHHSRTSGAPMTKDGKPLFYGVPASYAAAQSDGERWRWLLNEQIKVDANSINRVELQLAKFWREQLGIQNLQSYSYFQQISNGDKDNKEGIFQIHTLKDNETIAKLANGVKKFQLPDDQNFIRYYKQCWNRGNEAAADTLVEIYLNRRQYDKAAKLLETILLTKGDNKNKSRTKKLSQIKDNWGRFEYQNGAFTPTDEKKIVLTFRNAKEITLTLHEVDFQKIQDDRRKYLKSNPVSLNHLQAGNYSFSNLLIDGSHEKYIGKKIAEQSYKLKPRSKYWDTRADLTLPKVDKAGAYLLEGKMEGGKKFYTMVWVSEMMLVSRRVDGGNLCIATNAKTGKPIAGVELNLFGYKRQYLKKKKGKRRFNVLTKSFQAVTDESGQVFIKNQKNLNKYTWLIEARKDNMRAWSDTRLWLSYEDSYRTYKKRKAFFMTSQPVYKPASKVHGKFWVRDAKYDLGDKSNYAGNTFYVEARGPRNEKLGKAQKVIADEYGGVAFSLDLTDGAMLGKYSVILRSDSKKSNFVGSGNFRVEKYKKPEYEVIVDAPSIPVQLGDTFEATIRAKYFHGAPVTNAKVHVKVLRTKHNARWFPSGKWDWLYGGGYGWLDIERRWYPGWYSWGCYCPVPAWYGGSYERPELIMDEEMEIGEDGTVKVKVDSGLAKLVHSKNDHRYEIKVEVIDASRRTIFGSGTVLAARKPFQVTAWLNRGYAHAGERIQASVAATTLDGRTVKGWMTTSLYRVGSDEKGKIEEVKVREWERVAYSGDAAKIDFKADKSGQYRLVNLVTDEKGREVEGAILFTVRGVNGEEGDVRYNDLELVTDKRTYSPGDKVKVLVSTKRKDSSVWVFIRGSKDRRLLRIKGNSAVVEIPVTLADMPNFFIEAMTISDARVHKQVREVIVPPEKRTLNVAVIPSAKKYKPQEKGTVKIQVTDENGNPVKGDCVLSIYDKSLEYISGGGNISEIRSFFWKWKRYYQRSYWTQSTAIVGGYVVKKGALKMEYLGAFGRSLGFYYGDPLRYGLSKIVKPIAVAYASPTLNHSHYTAEYTHRNRYNDFEMPNDTRAIHLGGLPEPLRALGAMPNSNNISVRKDFADMVKWSGSVKLDKDGMAEVPVDYPDNLTTWKIKTWAMAHGTRVGEGSAEVITSKDLIIRLQAPRFFVEKDEVILSAVVHNYHAVAADARVSLELEGGTLKLINGDLTQAVNLAAKNGEKRVNWRVKVSQEGEAIIRMKVVTGNDNDAMEMKFPVYVHGIQKQMAWSREVEPGKESAKITIDVPAERRAADSKLEVRFSPTIAGAIVDALPYLADYEYKSTEHTLNRFVPAVITQKILKDMGINLEEVRNKRTNLNPQELGDDKQRAKQWKKWQHNPVFSEKEVDAMVRKGVQQLIEMQISDGGWGWFSGSRERSYSHTTAVVVHGLRVAQQNGVKIPKGVIKRGLEWLKRYEARETKKVRMWEKGKKGTKQRPSQLDAFVRLVLAENDISNKEMLGYQFRDKNHYGVYAKSLLGMSLHLTQDAERRDQVIRNIEQFLKYDSENQTAYLEMGNRGYWWYWYGNEIEAHAWYLKLLVATKPKSKQARGIVKYLVNNRKHATYWNSTRDTAYCIEAIADYMKASGEIASNTEGNIAEVEVLVDGRSYKKVKITTANLFSYDNKMTLAGDILSTGKHIVEIRRKGKGALYTNAYLSVFTKEDNIKKAGLEVKVERRYYKLVPKKAKEAVAGVHGQVVNQKVDKFERIALNVGDKVLSGDVIEVELLLESKNDYEYLLFSDYKAAGTEAESVRSGYVRTGGVSAYMEVHDEKVCFFIRRLMRGKHSLTYKLRAEVPGKFSALPAMADGMYAPELRANSNEMKLEIVE